MGGTCGEELVSNETPPKAHRGQFIPGFLISKFIYYLCYKIITQFPNMLFFYLKSLHIIFVVTWFAGLFYIVRLFIYDVEASAKDEPVRGILQTQFRIMEKRLWYGITWPSMVLAILFGSWIVYVNPWFLSQSFFLLKLAFVAGLVVYHFICHRIFKKLQNNEPSMSAGGLRMWNELATLFLVSIVFIIVLRNTLSFLWGIAGLVLFAALLMAAIRVYKIIREKSPVKQAE